MGKETVVEIKPVKLRTVNVEVVGITPLIVSNWSEKAKREMLDKQMGKAKEKKEKREPPEERFRELFTVKERPPDPVVLITPPALASNREPPPRLPELEESPESVTVPTLLPPFCQLVKTMLESAS